MRATTLFSLVALACTRGAGDTVEETDPDVVVETDLPHDSGDTGEAPGWTGISISPDALTVGVGAAVTYRLVATSPDGWRGVPPGVTWSCTEEDVAAVEDGVVSAMAVGVTGVVAAWEGGRAEAALGVDGRGALHVRVMDAETGDLIPGAAVQVGADEVGASDATGQLIVEEGVPASPIAVSAIREGYVTATVAGVVGRSLVVPLRPAPAADVPLQGTSDLGALEPTPAEVAVGLVGLDLPDPPWWIREEHLVASPRTVDVLGVDVELPSNVVLAGHADDWTIPAPPGERSPWGLAVTLPLAEALAAGAGGADPFALVAEHLATARWHLLDPLTPPGSAPFVPSLPLDAVCDVAVPDLPAGIGGDEHPLLLPVARAGDGWVAVGLGSGVGAQAVRHLSEPAPERVVAVVQAGGLGLGGGLSVSVGPLEGGATTLPPWTDVPPLPVVHVESREVGLDTDPDAQVILATVRDRHGAVRDLLAPAGSLRVGLPDVSGDIQRGKTTWELRVVATKASTFEELVASVVTGLPALGIAVVGTATAAGEVSGTPD